MLERLRNAGQKAQHYWDLFRKPIDTEQQDAIARIRSVIPEHLRVPYQALGTQQTGCAATYNIMEKCNFSCTACYLSKEANHTPALPFEEVCEQVDAIRDYLGPGGNIQLTAGEVTLMPVEDLIDIVKYSIDKQLSPMVMTHGDTFRQDPTYLERLMVEGGLQKVAIHIDSTQRGRMGMHKRDQEPDLHWLRDEFADMIRDVRKKTGQTLNAAHTFTIDDKNAKHVPEVMRWMLKNADAFRLISFQPTADVGRTRTGAVTGRRDWIWDMICDGVGQPLNRHPFIFGHPDCNFISLMFVVQFGDELHTVEVNREDKVVDQLFIQRFLNGTLSGLNVDTLTPKEQLANLAGRLALDPRMALDAAAFCLYRATGTREWAPRLLKAMATGKPWKINPFAIIVHNFMSRQELETEAGQARLEACTFRLPVNGEMIPMCQMNGTDLRTKLNIDARMRHAGKPKDVAAA